jgi:hypothetical protein
VCVSRNSTYLATLTTLSRLHHASCVVHCIMHHASCVVHCIMHHVSYTASCIMHHVSYVAGGRDDDAVMGARLVSFLVDLSLLAHGSLHFAPSLLAAAAHSLVAHALAHRRTSNTKGGVQDKGWQVRAVAPPPGLYGVVGTGVLWDVSTLCPLHLLLDYMGMQPRPAVCRGASALEEMGSPTLERRWALAHAAATSRSNLVSAWDLLSRWRLSAPSQILILGGVELKAHTVKLPAYRSSTPFSPCLRSLEFWQV